MTANECSWVTYIVQRRLAIMGTQFERCPFCGSKVFKFRALLDDDFVTDVEIAQISDIEICADNLDEKTAAIVIRGMADNGDLESYKDLPDSYLIKSPCGVVMSAPTIEELVEKWNNREW